MSDKNFQKVSDFYLWEKQLVSKNRKPVEPEEIFDGSIIYISRRKGLDYFFKHLHPKIEGKYVLITFLCGYRQSLLNYFALLEDENLIAWLGHVHDERMFNFPKFHTIPLGINKSKLSALSKKQKEGPLEKDTLLYMNFSLKTSPKTGERQNAYALLEPLPFTVFSEKKSYNNYLDDIKKAKFSLSPGGYSFDSYRTWETLFMGTIPIVKDHSQRHLYEGLPVLVVEDYDEITEEFLEQKYEEITSKTYSYDKLYVEYWQEYLFNIIREAGIDRKY